MPFFLLGVFQIRWLRKRDPRVHTFLSLISHDGECLLEPRHLPVQHFNIKMAVADILFPFSFVSKQCLQYGNLGRRYALVGPEFCQWFNLCREILEMPEIKDVAGILVLPWIGEIQLTNRSATIRWGTVRWGGSTDDSRS